MKLAAAAAIALAATALAVPPPPWMMEQAREGELDLQAAVRAHAEARSRGVDAPSPVYEGTRPFAPGGPLADLDDGMNVLILLVDFSDNVAQTEAVYFDSMGFAADSFSLRSYYDEVSYGQIDVVTVDYPSETGWQRAPETYEYYVGGNYGWGSYPANSQGMVEDVCELVDPVVDFSDYDNDNDGRVDGVNVMFAGTFDGTPETIWPHAWSLPGGGTEFDGVNVYTFSVQNEYDSEPGDKSAAVFCHEFGHVLGLPDLYDYGYDSNGIGDWGMMSFGVYNGGGWSPAHFCAWSRAELGILDPVVVTSSGTYEVPPVEESAVVYYLWTGGSPFYEYFLVENRRPIGYDAALPGWGLLIWHVDDSMNGNDDQWYPGHTSEGHYQVALEQADGLWEMEQGQNYGDQEDPFPGPSWQGADTFDYWTVPDSRDYDFEDTFVRVSSIPESADTVWVDMAVDQTGAGGGAPGDEPAALRVLGSPAAGSVDLLVTHGGGPLTIRVYDSGGRLVSTLHDGPMQSGDNSLAWSASGSPAGVYHAVASGSLEASATFVLLD